MAYCGWRLNGPFVLIFSNIFNIYFFGFCRHALSEYSIVRKAVDGDTFHIDRMVGHAVVAGTSELPQMKPSLALEAHRSELRQLAARHGVLRPRVFGSVLHGDDTDESDLDLLVDPSSTTTLFTLASLQIEAEQLLGVPVDVLTPKALPKRSRERVLQEAISL